MAERLLKKLVLPDGNTYVFPTGGGGGGTVVDPGHTHTHDTQMVGFSSDTEVQPIEIEVERTVAVSGSNYIKFNGDWGVTPEGDPATEMEVLSPNFTYDDSTSTLKLGYTSREFAQAEALESVNTTIVTTSADIQMPKGLAIGVPVYDEDDPTIIEGYAGIIEGSGVELPKDVLIAETGITIE